MSYTKCSYHNCDNTSRDISMFRFPVQDLRRLVLWLRNSGNAHLESLTDEKLRRRYICAAHFRPSDIHKSCIRSRLVGPAIPVHFQCNKQVDGSSSQTQEPPDAVGENDLPLSPEVLEVKIPTKVYTKKVCKSASEANVISTSSAQCTLSEGPILTKPYHYFINHQLHISI